MNPSSPWLGVEVLRSLIDGTILYHGPSLLGEPRAVVTTHRRFT
jgi:hypothetical protein